MMRKLLFIIACLLPVTSFAASRYDVISPDGSLKAEVVIAEGRITYSVSKDGVLMLAPSEIGMALSDGTAYDGTVKLLKSKKTSVNTMLDALFYKKAQVKENYNMLSLTFKTFDLQFRVYDAGVAYRFVSKSKSPFMVASETASFAFPGDWNMYVPYVCQHLETLETQFYN